MKISTKVALGLSVAATAGVVSAVYVSDKVFTKVRYIANRKKVEHFVDEKFNGNETLLNFVDHLDDKDIDSFMKLAKKVSNGRDQVAEYGSSAKDKIFDMMEH
ncbi:MAG TPA: hypothetical protein VK118_08405 [Tetragenococcus sp.]|nr:hypothetical protein [Tetragenococcus sp.]